MTTVIDKVIPYKHSNNDDRNRNGSNLSHPNKKRRTITDSDDEENNLLIKPKPNKPKIHGVDLNKYIKFKKEYDNFHSTYDQNLKELDRLNGLIDSDVNLDLKIVGLKAPDYVKKHALKILRSYKDDHENGAVYRMVLDKILSVPWGIYNELPVHLGDPYAKIQSFLQTAWMNMNAEIYGHDHVKNEILEYLSELLINPLANRIIGIEGPPGVGKTTLIKSGIAQTLHRPLQTIPLGGAKDANFLIGHSPVYKGSHSGALLNTLIQTQCMNPVLYFDEIDKISDAEIQHLLIHLTDPLQNSELTDKFTDIKMDLSRVIIIFSYNTAETIHPTLLNRIKQIRINEYTTEDKFNIMKHYKIPEMLNKLNLKDRIIFTDKEIKYLNGTVLKEPGIRNTLQVYETLLAKIIHDLLTTEESYKILLSNKKIQLTLKKYGF